MSEVSPPAAAGRAALHAALAKAQSLCRKAELDGRFEGKSVKYPYTSANERLAVARDALSQCGLALVRVGLPRLVQLTVQRELVDPGTGEARVEAGAIWILEEDFLLTHESGAALETGFRWPVIPMEPFRPLDKAFAGADTSGLSYLIRDVLLIPSEESDSEKELGGSPVSRIVQMPSRPPAPAAAPATAASAPVAPPAAAPSSSPAPSAPAQGGLALLPDPIEEAAKAGPASAHLAAEESAKTKLASAPLAATKLFALQPDVQDRALYLEIFAVFEKRAGSRERAIAAVKEIGVPIGTVPTVAQLRKFVEVMP